MNGSRQSGAGRMNGGVGIDTPRRVARRIAGLLLASLVICAAAGADPAPLPAADAGRPIVRNYDHRDFGGEVQNWDVLQGSDGVMFFANNAGVLEFDGRTWRLIELPARVAARSLTSGRPGEDRIYVGTPGDVGYLQADETGQLRFSSLLPADARRDRSFTGISRPVVTSSGLYFHLRKSVCRWRDGQLRCREADAPLTGIFAAHDTAYVHKPGEGLMEIVDSSLRLVPGGARFADEEITVLLEHPSGEPGRLLVGTRRFGLFLQDGDTFKPLARIAPDTGGEDQLLDAVLLPGGGLALATRTRGVLVLDRDGRVRQRIDRAAGLQENHVHGLSLDRQGGLWLALQHGVSRIELHSPFTVFDEASGLEREWREIVRQGETLYVRGYRGLFAGSPASTGAGDAPSLRFRRMEELEPPVWALLDVGDVLLASSRDGIYAIRDRVAKRIATYPSLPMSLYRSRRDPARVFVGLAQGLASLRSTDGAWRDEGTIDGLDETITSIAEDEGVLWLVSQWQRPIRVRFETAAPGTGPRPAVAGIERFGPEAMSGRISVREIGQRAVFLAEEGVLGFDPEAGAFRPTPALALLTDAGRRSFSWLAEDPHGNIWVAARKPGGVDFLWKQADGSYVLDNTGLRQVPVWSIYPDPGGGLVWFCTPDHLMRYDPSVRPLTSLDPPFRTLLRKVTANVDEVVFGGAVRSGSLPGPTVRVLLASSGSPLRFEFAAATYDDAERNEFQSYLEGFDEGWSAWSTESSRAYTNLPQGAYRFHARGRDVRGRVGEPVIFAFSIPPPWYRTRTAYAGYLLGLTLLLAAARRVEHRRSRAKLEREREHIELEKLRDLDRLKSRFFADVSHEFRTPISLILGPVGQMLQEPRPPEDREKLQLVRRHGEYLMRLISQMLDLSKLESRKLPLRAGPGDLREHLRAIVAPFGSVAQSRGVELRLDLPAADRPEGGVPAYFDGDVLEKTLNNLLGNALKFTPRGGSVTVSLRWIARSVDRTEPEGDVAEIAVSDTGVGIPAEDLPHVFDRFYQAGGNERTQEGFGIGLALVKELVELHRGSVSVESSGRGTTFIVRLPIGREHLSPDELSPAARLPEAIQVDGRRQLPAPAPPAAAGPDEQSTILVVEDHAELRAFLRRQLEPHYRVIEAEDGTDGLERAKSFQPALVLSDVMMTHMNGYDLCRAIKTNDRTAHIPVVLLTARAGTEDRLAGLDTGADCYMVKPFDPPELLAQVRNLVEQRRLLRQRFAGSLVLKPSEMAVIPADEAFLGRVLGVVEQNLEDPEFDVEQLGRAVGLSRSQLHRRLRALTRQAPTNLIRSIRLQRAAELLAGQAGSVAEIAYRVGFSSQAYFAKCFREQFGCSPKEYRDARLAGSTPGRDAAAGGRSPAT